MNNQNCVLFEEVLVNKTEPQKRLSFLKHKSGSQKDIPQSNYLKHSSINFGNNVFQSSPPRVTNINRTDSQALAFSYHRPAKVIQMLNKEASYQKKMKEVNQKIQILERIVQNHSIQLISINKLIESKTIKNHYPIQFKIPVEAQSSQFLQNINKIKSKINNIKLQITNQIKNDIIKPIECPRQQYFLFSLPDIIKHQLILQEQIQKINKIFGQKLSIINNINHATDKENKIGNIQVSKQQCREIINLKYCEYLQYTKGQQKGATPITYQIYKIDFEGYLLNSNNQYLLDSTDNRIQLKQHHLKMLKDKNVIK